MKVSSVFASLINQFAGRTPESKEVTRKVRRDAITVQTPAPVNLSSMTDLSWMFRDCDDWKQDLIRKPWGSRVSTYLWYILGDAQQLSDEEKRLIAAQFFVEGLAQPDAIGLHWSWKIPCPRRVLRIRGENISLLPRVSFRGHEYALYHIGHSNEASAHRLIQPPINFHARWNTR